MTQLNLKNHPPLLASYGLSLNYGKKEALCDVTFELKGGTVVAVLGPNGSGKTTLLKAVAGLFQGKKMGGVLNFRGQDLKNYSIEQRAQKLVYLGSEIKTQFPMTGFQVVQLGRTCRGFQGGNEIIRSAMEQTGCWHLKDRLTASLSGGEQQLILMARAIAQESKILLIDETLSKMDLHHQARIGKLLQDLKSKAYLSLVVSHDVNLASEWADTVFFMKQGRLEAKGAIDEIFTPEILKKIYPEAKLTVGKNPSSGVPKVFLK